MYKENILREYIKNSELRIFNDKVNVRLSKELSIKYDSGIYDTFLNHISMSLNKIENLNIKYPSNSKPKLYIYIVPDDNFEEYLQIPPHFRNGKRGGKPVPCFDLDGFNQAYGLNQYILESANKNSYNISKEVNEIHELAHLVMNQFKNCSSTISEGFAEVVPLYLLDYENIFEEHKNAIKNLKDSEIYTVKELLDSEKDNTYGHTALIENKSCSFRLSYISSYLFVRSCIEKIENEFNLDKIKATQHFLELLRTSKYINEWLIFEIADFIKIDKEKLLYNKDLQVKIINKL